MHKDIATHTAQITHTAQMLILIFITLGVMSCGIDRDIKTAQDEVECQSSTDGTTGADTCTAATTSGIAQSLGVSTNATVDRCRRVALKAFGNDKYVSAELGYTSMAAGELRARNTSIGPWEQFLLCDGFDAQFGSIVAFFSDLQAANGWVSAEFSYASPYTGMLRARPNTSQIGPWEEFSAVRSDCSSNCWAFYSPWGRKWVSAEVGYSDPDNGMLRARGGGVGAWEKFDLIELQ